MVLCVLWDVNDKVKIDSSYYLVASQGTTPSHVQFSQDGKKIIISQLGKNRAGIWNLETNSNFSLVHDLVNFGTFSPNSDLIYTGGGVISTKRGGKVWNGLNGALLREIESANEFHDDAKFLPDNRTIIVAGHDISSYILKSHIATAESVHSTIEYAKIWY